MSDQEFVIELDETEGHAVRRGIVESEDTEWLQERLERDQGKTSFRIMLDDEADTEGHSLDTTLRLTVQDEDDTEGHAIAVHFPSRAEADAFRRRLMITGVLVGTVALGAAGGVGLSALQSDADAGAAATVTTQVGPLDAHEAPAFTNQARSDAASSARLSGLAAANQVGPLDAHEAPAFEATTLSAADQAYADRLAGQAAATQVGPLDAHEAPAFQASSTDEGNSEKNDIGGPTPR